VLECVKFWKKFAMKDSSGTYHFDTGNHYHVITLLLYQQDVTIKKRVVCVPLIVRYSFGISFYRYSYDPFQQSPNENPEAELAINAGDYLLVWGNMDEVN